MNEKTIQTLKRPFPKEVIKRRRSAEGKMFAYVEIQHFVDRLNEAFAHDWSFELTHHEIGNEQVIVEVKLTAGGLVKTGIGGSSITRRTDKSIVSIADDLKIAEADALKRACRFLGIGAELYAADQDDDGSGVISGPPSSANTPPTGSHTLPFGERAHAPRERLTSAQLNAVKAIAKKRGLNPADVRQQIKVTYGVEVEYLTKRQASEVITSLDNGKSIGGTNGQQALAG